MPHRVFVFVAVPFDLPAGQTHGFWVDVAVPPGTVAGEYHGQLRLTAAEREGLEVPLSIEVWDVDLPRVSTMRTALGSPAQRMRSYYRERAREGIEPEPEDWDAVERPCAALLSRHRINATPSAGLLVPQRLEDGSFRIPEAEIEEFRAFVDRYVQTWGQAIRQTGTQVQVMVTEQTYTDNEAWGELHGAVDTWCPLFSLFRHESARKRQALGETIWTYTAICQREPTPWWHIDYPLLNYRVPAWIAWRYDITGLLYWGGMSYWRQVDDPWTDPKTLDRRDRRTDGRGPLFNGEGTLVYPARAVGYEGIAPSLRLKALRDAIEDYEYLAILDRQGQGDEAREVVLPLAGSWFQWERDPAAYQTARRRLAALILEGRRRGEG